jgi:hypothetical protein
MIMAVLAGQPQYVVFKTDSNAMLMRLQEPLRRALDGRDRFYSVEFASVGRVGEVLVTINCSKGHLPLLFGHEELEPGFVSSVVRDAVERFAL